MGTERVERRLAAVLAADVAGYSRLMGSDELGTLAALRTVRRDLVDTAIATHNGRIVKTTGDGMLVEFASAVDAVTCAMQFNCGLASRPTTAAGNGIFGCGDRPPNIAAKMGERSNLRRSDSIRNNCRVDQRSLNYRGAKRGITAASADGFRAEPGRRERNFLMRSQCPKNRPQRA